MLYDLICRACINCEPMQCAMCRNFCKLQKSHAKNQATNQINRRGQIGFFLRQNLKIGFKNQLILGF